MRKIYTKIGDNGTTSLIGGERISKSDDIVEAYGTIDELMAFIGVLYDSWNVEDANKSYLRSVQMILSKIATFYASKMLVVNDLPEENVSMLEMQIDVLLSGEAKMPQGFVVPGGSMVSSYAHVCRTVCRRAERMAAKVDTGSICLKFLNRLSDYFFAISQNVIM